MDYQQIDYNQSLYEKKKRRWKGVLLLGLLVVGILIYGTIRLGIASNKIEVQGAEGGDFWSKLTGIFKKDEEEKPDPNYTMPVEEKDRLDILILGIRGENDPDAETAGAYLSDTMMVFSYDKVTQKSAVISIPRDLHVKIYKKQEKINSAYAEGLARGDGLGFTKKLVSQISGVYIDHVAVIDFSSFEKIIDTVGGVDVVLAKPFAEKNQWGYEFSLPAGPNHLNGKDALYYARSRFSTNDFDRARRQQEIIFALKDKLAKIDIFSDPIQAFEVFKALRSNIKTDVGLWDMKSMIDLAGRINGDTEHFIISIDNLVYESHINNMYVLLPVGDNFIGIKQKFQDILK